MGKAYSLDLRERVLAACAAGRKPEEVAPFFQVSARVIYKWLKLRQETGSLAPRYSRPGPKPKLAEHRQWLRAAVAQSPDATLEELRAAAPVKVCIGALWNELRALGLSLKKSHPRR